MIFSVSYPINFVSTMPTSLNIPKIVIVKFYLMSKIFKVAFTFRIGLRILCSRNLGLVVKISCIIVLYEIYIDH